MSVNKRNNRAILAFYFLYLNIEAILFFLFKLVSAKTDTKRILIIKTDAIGDSIIWLDSAKEYRKHFPNQELVLLCNQSWREIAEKLPYFDKVISINRNQFERNPKYRLSFLWKMSKQKYDTIINPVYSRDYFVTDSLVRNIAAKRKIGSVGNYENTENSLRRFTSDFKKLALRLKLKADKFYTQLIPASSEPMMELIRNAEFIRNYIHPKFQSQLPEFPFEIPSFKILSGQNYIVLFIGASTLRKVWAPFSNYIEVIKAIDSENIVLCGGKEDIPLHEKFQLEVEPFVSKKVINLIGKTSLLELISVIKYADFIITNDTSASHITVAVQTPSVCILGGGHFGRFQPYQVENIKREDEMFLPKVVNYQMDCYNCNLVCKYIKDKITIYPCIAKIPVESLIQSVRKIQRSL